MPCILFPHNLRTSDLPVDLEKSGRLNILFLKKSSRRSRAKCIHMEKLSGGALML